eukprot:scaffold136500_cov35-Tisochrysis_lutea.AAC.3
METASRSASFNGNNDALAGAHADFPIGTAKPLAMRNVPIRGLIDAVSIAEASVVLGRPRRSL